MTVSPAHHRACRARQSGQQIVPAIAGEAVIKRIAGAVQVGTPRQLQVLEVGPQRVGQGGAYRVGARVQCFGDHVGGQVHHIDVVTQAPGHVVGAGLAIDAVVAVRGDDSMLSPALPMP